MAVFDFTGQADQPTPSPSPSPASSTRFDFTNGGAVAPQTPVASANTPGIFDFSGASVGPLPEDIAQRAVEAVTNAASVPDPADGGGLSVGGLIRNVGAGIAGAAEGVGNLVIGGVQDAAGQVQKLDFIPGLGGEQSLEKRIDEEGSALWGTLVGPGDKPSLFNMIADDLKHRYGPLFEGDFETFLHRMYEQPVSFALDAAAAGSITAAPFKAIEKASVLRETLSGTPYGTAKAAAVAGREGLARAVLGPGSREYGSFTSVATKTIRLPSNPVTRTAKEAFLSAVSSDLEAAFTRVRPGTPGYGLAAAGYAVAGAKGAERVLKPTFARLAESRAVGLMAGIKRSRLGEIRGRALSELEAPYLLGNKDAVPFQVVEYIQGSAPDTGLPGYGSIPIHMSELPEIGPEQVPRVSQMPDPVKLNHARSLLAEFGPEGVHRADFDTPHGVDPGARYEVIVASMSQSEEALQRAANALNGTVVGVRNYLPDGMEAWSGVHGFIETPDGIIEVSVGTDKLFRAQAAASSIYKRRDFHATEAQRWTEQVIELAEEKAPPGKIAAAKARAEWHMREVEAAQVVGSSMFEGPTRQVLSEMNGIEYVPSLQVADEMRTWSHKWMTDPEMDHGLSFQTIINRAYGPQRLTSFMYDMAQLEENLPILLSQFSDWNQAIGPLIDAFEAFPDNFIGDGLSLDLLQELDITNPVAASKAIVDNMRNILRESVINGDIPDYAWQNMHSMRLREGLPVPHYYPHIKISDLPMSDLAKPGRRGWKTAEPANVSQKWMGHLMEEGTFIMDPIEAYTRVFSSISKHHEVIRYLDEVIKTYGRTVSEKELQTLRGVANNPEVFINGLGAKGELSFRSMLEAATYDNIRAGMTVEKATAKALKDLMPDLQKNAVLSTTGTVTAIPRHIAKQVEAEIARSVGWKSRVFWDSPMAVWRASVLSFSPRWIFNNTIGNMIFTGIKDPRAIFYSVRQLNRTQRKLMEFLIGTERLADIEAGFSHNLPHMYKRFSDEAMAEAPRIVESFERIADRFPSRQLKSVSQYMRHLNSNIEEAFRRGVYLSAAERASVAGFGKRFASSKMIMDRLAREGVSEAAHKEALRAVDATLGNYTNLSPKEQDVVRRYIAPFYAFYRHVTKYVAKMPFENPLKTKVLLEISQLDDDMDKYLPEWLREAGVVGNFGDGQTMFLGLQSANPLTSVTNLSQAPLAVLNPVAKVVLERLTGRNLFTRKEFSSADVYEAHDGSRWILERDDEGNIVGRPQPLEGDVLPPLWRHIAMQFGPFSPIEKTIAATAGPGLGAQFSATGNVITDDGVPVFPVEPWTIFSNYFGIPFYSFDVEAEKQDYLAAQQEAAQSG